MIGIHENEGHDIGVIAQEVEKVFPEIVTTRNNGYKAVKYEKLTAVLIEAVKELTEKLVEAPKLQMLKLLEAVKFIDDNYKETEAIENEDSNLDYLVEEFFNEE
jgi:hypothetical protein